VGALLLLELVGIALNTVGALLLLELVGIAVEGPTRRNSRNGEFPIHRDAARPVTHSPYSGMAHQNVTPPRHIAAVVIISRRWEGRPSIILSIS
jgi:hypothetical protein